MDTETAVRRHYAHGTLAAAIRAALAAAGKNPDAPGADDLAPLDEFHVGGRAATAELVAQLGLEARMRILDVGCGIGGTARHLAKTFGCRVVGVDLSAEYVAVAAELSLRSGFSGRIAYAQASATALPFAAGAFDGAVMLHVGMNIADKAALFAEIRRVLVPGAPFGLYDLMRASAGALAFPLPWASDAATSLVETPETYRQCLDSAGFHIASMRDRREAALDLLGKLAARTKQQGPSPLGLQVVMGPEARRKVANMTGALGAGIIAPVEIVARVKSD